MSSITSSGVLIFLCTLQAGGESLSAEEPEVADVLSRIRRALALDVAHQHDGALRLTGHGTILESKARVTIYMDGRGSLSRHFDGPLPNGSAWDGREAWSLDYNGHLRRLELGEASEQAITSAALTGSWLLPGAQFRLAVDRQHGDDREEHLSFEFTGGHERGTIVVERSSWKPVRWIIQGGRSTTTLELRDYRQEEGRWFAGRVTETTTQGSVTEYSLDHAESIGAEDVRYDLRNAVPASSIRFGTKGGEELQVERAPSGHLLVHPRVNGRDVGWFIFDTCAGLTVIAQRAAGELNLPALGAVPAVGIGTVQAPVRRLDSLELEGVTTGHYAVMELDLSFLDEPMGRRIGGIIGSDLLASFVVTVDPLAGRVWLHDPAQFEADGLLWQKLYLPDAVPAVEAEFEGHKGLFRLDTGAAGLSLIFHHQAVERLRLLEGREHHEVTSGGVGGTTAIHLGILKSFHLGGASFENLEAAFAAEPVGALSDAYLAGTVGGECLKRFTLFLDYRKERISFRKHADE